MRREDFKRPVITSDDVHAMKQEWQSTRIEKLERQMERFIDKALDETAVVALINQIAEPSKEEMDADLALGLWSQDERIATDAQLEIDQANMRHCWEVTLFLPSLLEGDSVVSIELDYHYTEEYKIPTHEHGQIKDRLNHECQRVFHHIEWNEAENRANYRNDRDKKRKAEAERREKERLAEEKAIRLAAEDAWIDQEVRLADPLVGAF